MGGGRTVDNPGSVQDEYKSLALDEFPQMEKPFLGDRILMEKAWVREVSALS